MINVDKLPDTMYFGSSKRFDILKGRVFLTPHIGIASLFIIDINDLFEAYPKGYKTSCNISYRQWSYPNDLLTKPLEEVNVYHNIAAFEKEFGEGKSSGFIHTVDITYVKDKLSLFTTNNPDREVIYNGDEPLTIIECIPHTVKWDFKFNPEDVKLNGVGTAEKIV